MSSMTKQEAIEILTEMRDWNDYITQSDALQMAIDALEKKPAANSEDAISRQAAIDAMAKWDWQELYLPIHFKQLLEDLPSVSTEISELLHKAKSEIRFGENKAYNADFTMGCEYAIGVIERMFEEQVSTEKTGQWIDVEGYEGLLCKCSNCCKDGERYKHRTHQSKTNFCPDCGAKMGVEE